MTQSWNVTCFFLPQVHVHRSSDKLLNLIPARILPKEYGGEAGPLLDLWGKDLNVLSAPSPHSDRLWSITFGVKLHVSLTSFKPFYIFIYVIFHFYNLIPNRVTKIIICFSNIITCSRCMRFLQQQYWYNPNKARESNSGTLRHERGISWQHWCYSVIPEDQKPHRNTVAITVIILNPQILFH